MSKLMIKLTHLLLLLRFVWVKVKGKENRAKKKDSKMWIENNRNKKIALVTESEPMNFCPKWPSPWGGMKVKALQVWVLVKSSHTFLLLLFPVLVPGMQWAFWEYLSRNPRVLLSWVQGGVQERSRAPPRDISSISLWPHGATQH